MTIKYLNTANSYSSKIKTNEQTEYPIRGKDELANEAYWVKCSSSCWIYSMFVKTIMILKDVHYKIKNNNRKKKTEPLSVNTIVC